MPNEPFFSTELVQRLRSDADDIERRRYSLAKDVIQFPYRDQKAKEFAENGLVRRLGLLERAIAAIFEKCPLDDDTPLDSINQSDITIYLQSFVVNLYGCLDNIAWVWAFENLNISTTSASFDKKSIGLRKRNKLIWNSLPDDFRNYLTSLDGWIDYVVNFRDALAHRIPLYVPPYTVKRSDEHLYNQLELMIIHHGHELNTDDLGVIEKMQKPLMRFLPLMTHSYGEKSPSVPFPIQIIADFNTIDELTRKFLAALKDRNLP